MIWILQPVDCIAQYSLIYRYPFDIEVRIGGWPGSESLSGLELMSELQPEDLHVRAYWLGLHLWLSAFCAFALRPLSLRLSV